MLACRSSSLVDTLPSATVCFVVPFARYQLELQLRVFVVRLEAARPSVLAGYFFFRLVFLAAGELFFARVFFFCPGETKKDFFRSRYSFVRVYCCLFALR